MRLRLIRELKQDNWLAELNPDVLLPGYNNIGATDSHSFAYFSDGTLLVDPVPNRSHAQWGEADPKFEDAWERSQSGASLTGRYGQLEDQVLVVLWSFPDGVVGANLRLLRPCLRQLARYVPPHALVVGCYESVPPTLISDFVGARTAAPRRGHQYWQRRQTSEGRQTSN